MRTGAKLALTPLAVLPALALAFWGGVLPAPAPKSDAPYSDVDWGRALEAMHRGDEREAAESVGRYLAQVKSAGPNTRPVQFPRPAEVEAFWLNVHDALALQAFLAGGGPPGALARALKPHAIAGHYVTLNGIERRLRASDDPRIYFALTLLRPEDPPLLDVPLRGATLDAQLNDAARRYFGEPKNLRIADGTLHLSPLLGGPVKEMADRVAEQSLMQFVWTFVPRVCDEYPGCVTRDEIDDLCGARLDGCRVVIDEGSRTRLLQEGSRRPE